MSDAQLPNILVLMLGRAAGLVTAPHRHHLNASCDDGLSRSVVCDWAFPGPAAERTPADRAQQAAVCQR